MKGRRMHSVIPFVQCSSAHPTLLSYHEASMDRFEEQISGTLANFSTVIGPFFDRFAEVEPNEDARIRILGRRLGEAGIRAEHWRRIAAGATSR